MTQLLDRYLFNPHWRIIKVFGQAKILGISATTIIIAPLLSRILIKLNEMETTIRQSHPALNALFPLIKLHFELPLSIKFLVGSAAFALVAKGIYEAMCPLYIKAGDSYQEYRHKQAHATAVLADGFLKIVQKESLPKKQELVSGLRAMALSFSEPNFPATCHWAQDTKIKFVWGSESYSTGPAASVMRDPKVGESVFYVLRDLMDDSRRTARVVCAVLYGIAFALLAWALCIQLWWALRGMLL